MKFEVTGKSLVEDRVGRPDVVTSKNLVEDRAGEPNKVVGKSLDIFVGSLRVAPNSAKIIEYDGAFGGATKSRTTIVKIWQVPANFRIRMPIISNPNNPTLISPLLAFFG